MRAILMLNIIESADIYFIGRNIVTSAVKRNKKVHLKKIHRYASNYKFYRDCGL